jgi:hypothetical protein
MTVGVKPIITAVFIVCLRRRGTVDDQKRNPHSMSDFRCILPQTTRTIIILVCGWFFCSLSYCCCVARGRGLASGFNSYSRKVGLWCMRANVRASVRACTAYNIAMSFWSFSLDVFVLNDYCCCYCQV